MPTLTEIRQAIDDTLQSRIDGLRCFGQVSDVTQLPAVVVMPARDAVDFNGAMGRGLDTYRFELYVLVQRGEITTAQSALDQYVTGSGPRSIRQVIYENDDLGIGVDDASVESVREYGGKFESARLTHVGAIVRLIVRTSGK